MSPGRHRAGRQYRARAALLAVSLAVLGILALAVGPRIGDIVDSPDRAPAGTAWPTSPSRPASPTGPEGPSPSPDPSPSPSPEPARERVVIHGTGDVNLDTDYIPSLLTHGYGYAWSGLGGLFRRDDLTVVNLECAVSTLGTPYPKDFVFRADPAALAAMARAGVDVANLGNNHSQDYGAEAMLDTRRNLLENGIAPVGAGEDQRMATAPAVFDIRGWRVAVLGFGGVYPIPDWFAGPDHAGMANGDDIPTMVAAVRRADRLADLVVVTIHWGVELDTEPRPEDVARGHAMIDAGADAIFGHHAHRLQPMETYRGRPIFWGLGNFVWPRLSDASATTAVAEVVVTPEGKVTGRLIPAFIEDDGHPVLLRG